MTRPSRRAPRTASTTPSIKRFINKAVIVTGSGRGIGQAIALKFAAEGAAVVVNFFRNREPAQETVDAIRLLGSEAILVKANVAEADDRDRLFHEAESAFGGVDILINNAASGFNRPVMEQHERGWDWTMNINARAALFMAQRTADSMRDRGGGHIVNMSSLGSTRVFPDYVTVGASKAALEAITRYLAIELADRNISVNAVSAGIVETDALKSFPHMQELVDRARTNPESIRDQIPAGRILTADDVANVVLFLCSRDAAMIRGQVITVDGGASLR